MEMSQYRGLFVAEARNYLATMSQQVVALEREPANRPLIDSLFRIAHSLKGMAASMEYHSIAELAHHLEDLMDLVRKGAVHFAGDLADLLLAGGDLLGTLVDEVAAEGAPQHDIGPFLARLAVVNGTADTDAAGLPAASPELEVTAGSEAPIEATVRVRTTLLDRLVDLVGELITVKHRISSIANEATQPLLDETIGVLAGLLRELHGEVIAARMLPLAAVTRGFPRLVRDLARRTGKQVEFVAEVGDLSLDRGIVELLADPLGHILRNAVDHGIEPEGERVAGGKPGLGRLRIVAWREQDQAIIAVSDDGRGMDPKRLAAEAVAKGLLSAVAASALSPRDALLLVCLPGFSTARQITEVSGRGVGMDAVRAMVQAVGGSLAIDSIVGQGTTVTLKLPLTIAIINVLLVRIGPLTMAVPVSAILRTLDLPRQEIGRNGSRQVFLFNGETIPLVSLSGLFTLPYPPVEGASVPVLVTEVKGRRVGLTVDAFLHQQEVFVKPLGPPLSFLPSLSGGALLGSGEIAFIVDVANLHVPPGMSAESTL